MIVPNSSFNLNAWLLIFTSLHFPPLLQWWYSVLLRWSHYVESAIFPFEQVADFKRTLLFLDCVLSFGKAYTGQTNRGEMDEKEMDVFACYFSLFLLLFWQSCCTSLISVISFTSSGVCGCCGALRPRYKRLVDNIFPEDPEVRSSSDFVFLMPFWT